MVDCPTSLAYANTAPRNQMERTGEHTIHLFTTCYELSKDFT